jgi:hypothetical protein
LVSQKWWGKALPCENITVTNCRLSAASAGIKFSEGNIAGILNIQICQPLCLINVNRGLAFNDMLGGGISHVLVSNVTINCNRFDWFWAGDGQPIRFKIAPHSEFTKEPAKPDEAPPGAVPKYHTPERYCPRQRFFFVLWTHKSVARGHHSRET